MRISGLKTAVNKHTGHIPGAFSFIFDGEAKEFIYVSEKHPEIEKSILKFNEELDFAERTTHAKNDISRIQCDRIQRILVFKKLATNLYFGICIEPDDDIVDLATNAMAVDFNL